MPQLERRYGVILNLAGAASALNVARLLPVLDKDEPETLIMGAGEQRLVVACAEHGGFVDD